MIGSIILLLFTFVGTLYLETQLASYVLFEMLVLVVGILVSVILLAGEAMRARWVWKLNTVFYSVAMGNLAFLFMATKNFLVFGVTLFFVLVAFIRSVSRLEDEEEIPDPEPVETYEVGKEITPDSVDPIIVQTTPRKTTKKKTTRKKASRKKTSRRKTRKSSRRKSTRRR